MSSNKNQGFLASILVLATGSTLAQVITLAVLPFITRLYGPEAFGVLSIFIAISALLIGISSLQFAEVVVICDSAEDADRAVVISSLIVFTISALTGALLWLYSSDIGQLLGIGEYSYLLKFVAVAVLLRGLRQVFRRWLLREHKMRRIAASEVVMAVADRGFTVLFGLFTAGSPVGLVFGRLIGLLFGFFTALKPRDSRPFIFHFSPDQLNKMTALVKRYKRFPYYSWAVLLEMFAKELPVLLLSGFLGPGVAGGYALARRVLAEPAVLLGSAVAQSYYQYAAREKDQNSVAQATAQLTLALIKLIAFPIIIGLSCAPELIPVIFGDTWGATGWYTLILAPMFMVYFVMRPLNRIFNIKERQREKGIFAAQNIVLIVATLSLSTFIANDYIALAVFSFASTVFLCHRAVWLMKLVDVDMRAFGLKLLASFLLTVCALTCSFILRTQLEYSGVALIASSVGLTLVYLMLVVLRDEQFLTVIRSLKRK